MAYKGARRIEQKKAGGESAGRKKGSGRRWLLVDDNLERRYSPSESLARLSHDIRTQLYIIIGYAELMLEEIPGKLNDEQRHNLNDVLNSGKRLQSLLDDIVSQPENRSSGAKAGRPSHGVE